MSAEVYIASGNNSSLQSTTVGGSKPLHRFIKGQPKIIGVRHTHTHTHAQMTIYQVGSVLIMMYHGNFQFHKFETHFESQLRLQLLQKIEIEIKQIWRGHAWSCFFIWPRLSCWSWARLSSSFQYRSWKTPLFNTYGQSSRLASFWEYWLVAQQNKLSSVDHSGFWILNFTIWLFTKQPNYNSKKPPVMQICTGFDWELIVIWTHVSI